MSDDWQPVFGSFLYKINKEGVVRSISGLGRSLKPKMLNGQLVVYIETLNKDGRHPRSVVGLMADTFMFRQDIPIGYQIEQIDGDPMNCRLDNLRWVYKGKESDVRE